MRRVNVISDADASFQQLQEPFGVKGDKHETIAQLRRSREPGKPLGHGAEGKRRGLLTFDLLEEEEGDDDAENGG